MKNFLKLAIKDGLRFCIAMYLLKREISKLKKYKQYVNLLSPDIITVWVTNCLISIHDAGLSVLVMVTWHWNNSV